MARYRMRIRTDWSAPDAFAYMADLTNFAEWDPGVSSAEQVAGSGPGLGAEYDIEASGSELRYEVDVFDPGHRVRATGRNRWLTSIDSISVAAEGTGSVVTYDADLVLHGLLKVGDPILTLAFRRIGDRAADGLIEKLQGERI
jgi:hypothetical protein